MAPDPQQLALFSAESTVAAFASVVVDIPARALSEPYAYGVPGEFADDIAIGSTVLVTFGHRAALGYVVALAETLGDLPGAEGLDPVRVRPVRALLAFGGLCGAERLEKQPATARSSRSSRRW